MSGVVLAFAALAFLGLLKAGGKWFTLPKNPDWFSGSLLWVAVTAAAGVLVVLLRRVLNVPLKLPGTIKKLREERVDPSTVLQAVGVSLVSLIGGASLGPEAALGQDGRRFRRLGFALGAGLLIAVVFASARRPVSSAARSW